MNRAKKEHTSPPAIKVVLKEEEMQRIRKGPLRETEGRGAATWARKLIIKRRFLIPPLYPIKNMR